MTYRAVVKHVRYWRGRIHRWSTVYQYVGTASSAPTAADCQHILTLDDNMCYGEGASNGGTYECAIYNQASGGVPIAVYTRFDWTTPGTWVGYAGTAWGSVSVNQEPAAEVALLVEYPAGLGRTGKPVSLRKWYHAVPVSGSTAGSPDIGAAPLATLRTGAEALMGALGDLGLVLGSRSGRIGGDAHVQAFYGNHQMPKGRRKKKVPSLDPLQQVLVDVATSKLLGRNVF